MFFGVNGKENTDLSDNIITEIDFGDVIVETTTIDGGETLSKTKISIRGNEGPEPHFHITAPDFHSCVYLDKVGYFSHNNTCKDKLSKDQKESLVKLLNKTSKRNKNMTNYEFLVASWNSANHEGKPVFKQQRFYARLYKA